MKKLTKSELKKIIGREPAAGMIVQPIVMVLAAVAFSAVFFAAYRIFRRHQATKKHENNRKGV